MGTVCLEGASLDRRFRLGIDIGGTFTDLTLLDQERGRLASLKTPTIPADPALGVVNGLQLLKKTGVQPEDISYFVHGTTIGLNTLLQRKGADIALFVTEGFRDLLSLQRLRLPVPYDFRSRLPEPLIPRNRVFPVRERLLHDGTEHTPVDLEQLDHVIDEAVKAGVEGIAVCLLHSYRNPLHERQVAERIRARVPSMDICLSSALWPQMREYERAIVAVVNLYIQSNVKRYFATLQERLAAEGLPAAPLITQSNGGIMDIGTASEAPVRTLFSGPAAGVIGAARLAQSAGIRDVITFDVGGTSADISIIEDGKPAFAETNQLAGFPIMLPAVSIYSIGAGGGSLVWLDNGGLLKVGPESAGSDPGPACYGRGGRAALTDAFVLCGYLNPTRFAAGNVALYPELSAEAVRPIAEALRLDVESAADRIVQVAVANMYAELNSVLEQQGIDPRDFTVLAYGGAGPLLANFIAEEIQADGVQIPPMPGTLCALGALNADFAYDAVQSGQVLLADVSPEALREQYAKLAGQASEWLERQAHGGLEKLEDQRLEYSMDARYAGQAFEITLSIDPSWLEGDVRSRIADLFHESHQRQYGHCDRNAPVELIHLRVRIIGQTGKPPLERLPEAAAPAPSRGERELIVRGERRRAAVYARSDLTAGHVIAGPAVIEQDDATVLVLPGWNGRVDEYGNIILRRAEEVSGHAD